MLNLAVFVSGGGTNLQAIIDAKKAGGLKNINPKLVLSSTKRAYALTRAAEAKIKSVVAPKKLSESQDEYGLKIIKTLKDNKIDLIALAGFLTILPENVVKEYDHRIVNIHPSLIPAFCGKGFYGLKVHEEALKRGVKLTGATAHYVNEIPDGGEIIIQKAVVVNDGDTPEILQRRVMEQAEWIIFPRALEIAADKIISEDKNHA